MPKCSARYLSICLSIYRIAASIVCSNAWNDTYVIFSDKQPLIFEWITTLVCQQRRQKRDEAVTPLLSNTIHIVYHWINWRPRMTHSKQTEVLIKVLWAGCAKKQGVNGINPAGPPQSKYKSGGMFKVVKTTDSTADCSCPVLNQKSVLTSLSWSS